MNAPTNQDNLQRKEFLIRELKQTISILDHENVKLQLEVDKVKAENTKLKRERFK
jgi:hypothetical protein